jgi:formate dehydrogenase major subunit
MVVIPETITTIHDSAFSENNYLTTIVIQSSVTTIEDNAFAKISDVVLPGKSWVEKAGTFTNCEGLEQCFDISAEIENDNMSEMEIFDKLA